MLQESIFEKKVKKLYPKHALYAKNAKKKLKKQNAFLSHFHHWWHFNWAGGSGPSLAMPMSLTGINIGYYLSPDKPQHYLKPNSVSKYLSLKNKTI